MPTLILLGPRCSGKKTIAEFLIREEGYERVRIASSSWASTSKQRDGDSLIFNTASDFLDYATLNWRNKYVTCDRMSRNDLDGFVKRPWVLLVGCEARTAWRWKRRNELCAAEGGREVTLEDFVLEDDLDMYGDAKSQQAELPASKTKKASAQTLHIPNGTTASSFTIPPPPSPELSQRTFTTKPRAIPNTDKATTALAPVMRLCNLHIDISAYESTELLYSHLRNLDLSREDRMRPGWDKYFMTLAGLASLRSNCMKRRVGAVLVSNKRVISTGYNGTPRGMRNCNEGGCARCNSTSVSSIAANGSAGSGVATPVKSGVALDECLCLHAEENALLEAGRDRAEGGVLYCNTCPCLRCAVKICQTGCREVCYSQGYSMDEMSARIFKEAGVIMRQIEMFD